MYRSFNERTRKCTGVSAGSSSLMLSRSATVTLRLLITACAASESPPPSRTMNAKPCLAAVQFDFKFSAPPNKSAATFARPSRRQASAVLLRAAAGSDVVSKLVDRKQCAASSTLGNNMTHQQPSTVSTRPNLHHRAHGKHVPPSLEQGVSQVHGPSSHIHCLGHVHVVPGCRLMQQQRVCQALYGQVKVACIAVNRASKGQRACLADHELLEQRAGRAQAARLELEL